MALQFVFAPAVQIFCSAGLVLSASYKSKRLAIITPAKFKSNKTKKLTMKDILGRPGTDLTTENAINNKPMIMNAGIFRFCSLSFFAALIKSFSPACALASANNTKT